MGFIVKGQIVMILPAQQGVSQRGNQWVRQSYILEHESGQYPKRMVFDVRDAKIQELNLQQGEWVTLHFNCDCREYPQGSGKFFNSIEAWKVERQGQQQAVPQGQVQQPVQQMPPQGYQQVQQPQYQQAPVQSPFPPQVNTQGQPVQQQQQPMPGAAPFPPQVNAQGQPMQQPAPGTAPFPPQQPASQQGQNGKLPF